MFEKLALRLNKYCIGPLLLLFHRQVWLFVGAGFITVALVFSIVANTILLFWVFPLQTHSTCIRSETSASLCFLRADLLSNQPTTSIAASPDGQILASSHGQIIQLWDLVAAKPLATLTGHLDWVSAIIFSPEGQTLASSSLDGTIRIWNSSTGKLLSTFLSGRMTELAFSPDGQLLASGSRNSLWFDSQPGNSGVQIWEVKTGKQLPPIGSGWVASLAFSPDGQILAVGNGSTQLWQLETRQLIRTLDSGNVTTLGFTPNGQTLVSGSSKIKAWDVNAGKLLYTLKSGSSDLALSPDGQNFVVASASSIQFWQLASGRLRGALRGSWYSNLSVTFGLGGRAVISSSSDGLKIWRAQ